MSTGKPLGAARFRGVLFFPVTPFDDRGELDRGLLADHIETGLEHGAGAVFVACGTGEFHALSAAERAAAADVAVATTSGRRPVVAGVGGSLGDAIVGARRAADAGMDALLLLPPYLVTGSKAGLRAWVESVVEAGDRPVVLYHRANAVYAPDLVSALARDPRVIGFKDGVGDVALAQSIVSRVGAERPDFAFFNGLLTAELSQVAYRAIGVPLYSSAVFAMAPAIANAFYRAYTDHDDATCRSILDGFYRPLATLRDETPGFAVSLIKAGLRLGGLPVGPVRPPLTDPDDRQTARLAELLRAGAELVGAHQAEALA